MESFEWGGRCIFGGHRQIFDLPGRRKDYLHYNLCRYVGKVELNLLVCVSVLFGKTVRSYWLRLGKCVPASLGGAGLLGLERMGT